MHPSLLLALLAASCAVVAVPNTIDPLESRSLNRTACRDQLKKAKLQAFCKADLAYYKANKCTFPKRIPWIPVPATVSQYAQQACSDLLGVSVPTCAPVIPAMTSTYFSGTPQVLPADPSTLNICKSCKCTYINGIPFDDQISTGTSDPLAIQCLYEYTGTADYFTFPSFVDAKTRSRAINYAYGALGGGSAVEPYGHGSSIASSIRGGCDTYTGCSVYVGQRGADAPSDITTPVASSFGGGGPSTGGAGGGSASYISKVRGTTEPLTNANVILVSAGSGGSGATGSNVGDNESTEVNDGSFLQGGRGTNGGGGGGSGRNGGRGSSQPSFSGDSVNSDYDAARPTGKIGASDNGNGRVYITFGCTGSCDECERQR